MDLKALTDDQLDTLRIEVLTEQERRARLASIPTQITALAADYRAGGGDNAVLLNAINRTGDDDE